MFDRLLDVVQKCGFSGVVRVTHSRHRVFVFPAQDRATRFPPHIKNAHVMPRIGSAAHVAASLPFLARRLELLRRRGGGLYASGSSRLACSACVRPWGALASAALNARARGRDQRSRLVRRSERRVREVADHGWLISFMHYDPGFFDDQCSRVECAPNPFTAKVLPMSP